MIKTGGLQEKRTSAKATGQDSQGFHHLDYSLCESQEPRANSIVISGQGVTHRGRPNSLTPLESSSLRESTMPSFRQTATIGGPNSMPHQVEIQGKTVIREATLIDSQIDSNRPSLALPPFRQIAEQEIRFTDHSVRRLASSLLGQYDINNSGFIELHEIGPMIAAGHNPSNPPVRVDQLACQSYLTLHDHDKDGR